jgi:uncharacterized ubiquitin-like protein YukD
LRGDAVLPGVTHINVTVDFTKKQFGRYDLRIPVHQPVKQLLANLTETLQINVDNESLYTVKVPAKSLLLTDDDRLSDYPVTDGDILVVL